MTSRFRVFLPVVIPGSDLQLFPSSDASVSPLITHTFKGCHQKRERGHTAVYGSIPGAKTEYNQEDSMTAIRLYDSTKQIFDKQLAQVLDTQRTNLALLVSAAAQVQTCHLADLARALALPSKQASKIQRIRRLLDNERITQRSHYQPIVRSSLQGLSGQPVDLALDRVLLRDRQNVLVASLGFKRRAVPLAWNVLEHRGASDSDSQITLLKEAFTSVPSGVRVTVHGDAEFCTTKLFAWAREQGWSAILGLRSNTHVYRSQEPEETPQSIAKLAQERKRVYLQGVYVTEERYGPVNLIIWWDGEAEDDKVRAVMTDLPANGQTWQRGRRRMWIETLFRDWQSGGFHLDQSGVFDRQRFTRLIVALALAYVLFLSIGRWVVKRGYRDLIDDGTPRHWHYSLFQLGIGWFIYCQVQQLTMPVFWSLYQ
jgi:Transposase DDE domain